MSDSMYLGTSSDSNDGTNPIGSVNMTSELHSNIVIEDYLSNVQIIDDYMVCSETDDTHWSNNGSKQPIIQPMIYKKYKTYGEAISGSFIKIVGSWMGFSKSY
jgi:hypothetical protein